MRGFPGSVSAGVQTIAMRRAKDKRQHLQSKLAGMHFETVAQGVIAIKEGAWYTPDESGTDTAGCGNVLSADVSAPCGATSSTSRCRALRAKPKSVKKDCCIPEPEASANAGRLGI